MNRKKSTLGRATRKICVVTGTRAEYGLLKPLLHELKTDCDISLQLIVTAAHLSHEFGCTYQEIEKDGFTISEKIEMLLSSDTSVGVSKSMGVGMISFAEAYERLQPDIVVVMGDRFELISAVSSAHISRIPVAHFSGGEITGGAVDDAFRHAVTKMSHLHFTSTEEYRKRVVQLGEHPSRVFNVGEIGLDNIRKLQFLSKKELEKELGFCFKERNLIVTFHPVTLENKTGQAQFQNLLAVLGEQKETGIIFTKANADTNGRVINQMIDDFVSCHQGTMKAFYSLGTRVYLSVLKIVDSVVGNSSSGIVEAPSFRVGTINIGDRQKGRIRACSVIDCQPTKKFIRAGFARLYSKEFQSELKRVQNPFDRVGGVAEAKKVLKECDLSNILKKTFYDVEFTV